MRRLHRAFKGMHWNSLRYCIGFPPEFWYRIADEEGILIQDEFPIWHGHQAGRRELKSEELIQEYTEWMQERWNHPCVVIWDAQNETVTAETGKAIQAVRGLDLSNRPWDNGYGQPQVAGRLLRVASLPVQQSQVQAVRPGPRVRRAQGQREGEHRQQPDHHQRIRLALAEPRRLADHAFAEGVSRTCWAPTPRRRSAGT